MLAWWLLAFLHSVPHTTTTGQSEGKIYPGFVATEIFANIKHLKVLVMTIDALGHY